MNNFKRLQELWALLCPGEGPQIQITSTHTGIYLNHVLLFSTTDITHVPVLYKLVNQINNCVRKTKQTDLLHAQLTTFKRALEDWSARVQVNYVNAQRIQNWLTMPNIVCQLTLLMVKLIRAAIGVGSWRLIMWATFTQLRAVVTEMPPSYTFADKSVTLATVKGKIAAIEAHFTDEALKDVLEVWPTTSSTMYTAERRTVASYLYTWLSENCPADLNAVRKLHVLQYMTVVYIKFDSATLTIPRKIEVLRWLINARLAMDIPPDRMSVRSIDVEPLSPARKLALQTASSIIE